jgi:MFS family permease
MQPRLDPEARDDIAESSPSRGSRGYLVAAVGSTLGMVAVFVIAALFFHLTGEPTFSQTLSFDHGGQLELAGIAIFLIVGIALVVGSPLGAWFALTRARHPRRGLTVIAVALLAPLIGLFGLERVPSGSEDPVLEPYLLLASAFVAGLVGRFLTTFAMR